MKRTPKTFCDSRIFETGMGQVVITRHRGGGRVEMGVFLVDVFCLGVKNAFFTQCEEGEFDEFLQKLFPGDMTAEEHSGAWGRKLVEDAMGYARNLGLAAHRDYKKAARVMGGINPKDCDEKFVFGQDGKPMFIGGPNESQARCEQVIRILTKKCGKDGFHYTIPASDSDRIAIKEELGLDEWEDKEEAP